jgi:hypothetical protein
VCVFVCNGDTWKTFYQSVKRERERERYRVVHTFWERVELTRGILTRTFAARQALQWWSTRSPSTTQRGISSRSVRSVTISLRAQRVSSAQPGTTRESDKLLRSLTIRNITKNRFALCRRCGRRQPSFCRGIVVKR